MLLPPLDTFLSYIHYIIKEGAASKAILYKLHDYLAGIRQKNDHFHLFRPKHYTDSVPSAAAAVEGQTAVIAHAHSEGKGVLLLQLEQKS